MSQSQVTNSATSRHGLWSSRLRFILATTGAAVGLGNIWKFPYMAGDNGGSAFVLVYLLCVIGVGVPIMLAEIISGKLGRCNAVTSLRELARKAKHSERWSWLGWWGSCTLILVLAFYSVVSGWSLAYIYYAASGQLQGLNPHDIQQLWTHLSASPHLQLLLHGLFMALTVLVVAQNLQSGLERAATWLMPALFAILVVLVGYAAHTPGFTQAWQFLLSFKLTAITPAVVISALGHAFFSLAIGAGCLLAYGCYLPEDTPIGAAAASITLLNLLVALLAGIAIFSLVFSYGLSPSEGPSLMFQVLPIAFARMGGGALFGSLFFILLLFAAWTSSISLAEPLVVLLMEKCDVKRIKAALLVGSFAWLLGIGSALSFNSWQHITLFNHWTIFTATTDITTNVLLPLGGLGYAIFAGYILNQKAAAKGLGLSPWAFNVWRYLLRWVSPMAILIILGKGWMA